MDFQNRLGCVRGESVFSMKDFFVWCGSITEGDDGRYYLLFSYWEKSLGFEMGWCTASKIGWAVSGRPDGGFAFGGTALTGSGQGWDADCVHNPTVIRHGGKYYMYYMGNFGNGEFWDHRNHQRIGVASADHPAGPWKRSDKPVIDITPGAIDSLMTSNPTVCEGPDGRIHMVYKAVADNGKPPVGGAVICGAASADHPLGPFVKEGRPLFVNPESEWSVEDPFLWYEDGKYRLLAKDFTGYYSGHGAGSTALFESEDAVNFVPDPENPLGFLTKLTWAGGTVQQIFRMERPQIFIRDGKPAVLCCACMPDDSKTDSYNIAIPIKK